MIDVLTNIHGREVGLAADGALVLNYDDGTQLVIGEKVAGAADPKTTRLTAQQVAALGVGQLADDQGGLYAISEVADVVTLTATGTAFTGACEYGGYFCRVAAGNITVYDNTSATGAPIVPTTALAVGPMPWMGAGTNARRRNSIGLHVVLTGSATVDVLVS